MKQVFYFMLGVSMVVLTSAATVNIMTVKPSTPKTTIVKSFRTMYGLEQEMEEFTREKVKQGYIVKSVAMMDDESMSKGIVVLEKY